MTVCLSPELWDFTKLSWEGFTVEWISTFIRSPLGSSHTDDTAPARHYKNLLNELLNTSIKKYKTGFRFFSVAMAALPGSDKVQRECEGGERECYSTHSSVIGFPELQSTAIAMQLIMHVNTMTGVNCMCIKTLPLLMFPQQNFSCICSRFSTFAKR